MNKENLLKLATYLLSGKLETTFDMQTFTDMEHGIYSVSCGTVGCAVGHGPYAGIDKRFDENWVVYSQRVFQLNPHIAGTGLDAWRWCFSSFWAEIDNTPEGAGKRILYLLRKGLPEEWLKGSFTLCYQNETL